MTASSRYVKDVVALARGDIPVDVYVVDPVADYESAVTKIETQTKRRALIYVPDRAKQARMSEILTRNESRLSLLPYETNNSLFDDRLFHFCQAISARVAHHICGPGKELPEELTWSFSVVLQDKLVGRIRPAEQLRSSVQDIPVEKILYIPPEKPTDLWQTLKAVFPEAKAIGDVPLMSFVKMMMRVAGGGSTAQFNVEEVARASSGRRIFVCGSVWDQQYRNTVFPVVRHLIEAGQDVVFIPSAKLPHFPINSFLEQHGLIQHIESKRLLLIGRTEKGQATPLRWATLQTLSKLSTRDLSKDLDPEFARLYSSVLNEAVIQESLKIAAGCSVMFRQMQTMVSGMAGVVVCPGRHLRANMLVAAAKSAGLPTTEIQSGTIGKSRRFVPPPSDTVLCMDEGSLGTYRFIGKKTGLKVVGSVRLDYDLAQFRGISREEARKRLSLTDHDKIWMLASQPIGVDEMKRVTDIVFSAAEQMPGVTVLVKMHPNETPEYNAMYLDVASSHPGLKVITDQKMKSVLAAVASDVVFTYFSTVGVESFALGRTTISVNPSSVAPTFDLVAMGVAELACGPAEILSILSRARPKTTRNAFLTDANAANRCVEHIIQVSEMAHPKPVTDDAPWDEMGHRILPHTGTNGAGSSRKLNKHVRIVLSSGWYLMPPAMRSSLLPLAKRVKARL